MTKYPPSKMTVEMPLSVITLLALMTIYLSYGFCQEKEKLTSSGSAPTLSGDGPESNVNCARLYSGVDPMCLEEREIPEVADISVAVSSQMITGSVWRIQSLEVRDVTAP